MRAVLKGISEATPVLMAGALLLFSPWNSGCGDTQCLAAAGCPDSDVGTWVKSKQPCSDNEVYPCQKVTECGETIYCRLMPDTDTKDTDSETDTGSTAVPDCQTGNTTIEWLPNPTSDYDCGPGCVQVVFEEPNTVVEWDVRGKYLVYSTQNAPLAQARVVDVEVQCFAKINHPEFGVQGLFGNPSIYGERIAFKVGRYGDTAVNTTELSIVSINDGVWQQCLRVDDPPDSFQDYRYLGLKGNIVAMQVVEGAGPKGQVVLYDLLEDAVTGISEPQKEIWYTRMSGDHVVWTDHTGNVADIYAHRISTGDTWNLTDHPSGQFAPRIDGTRVVWTDLRHGGGSLSTIATWNHADIFMYDFATNELTAITNQDWLQLYPDIQGDRVVWQDSRACSQPNNAYDWSNVHIWMYDIATGQQHQISNLPGAQSQARIDGNRVFFLAPHPDGYYAIFMQDLAALGL